MAVPAGAVAGRAPAGLTTNPEWWRRLLGLLAAGLLVPLLILISVISVVSGEETAACQGAGGGLAGGPATAAARDIPRYLLPIFHGTERRYGIPWNLLAGIMKVETDFGRLNAAGVTSGANPWGASGFMQIGTGGAAGNTWATYATDGNEDGRKDVYDPADAVPGAAKKLRADGFPDVHKALFAYNHAEWYVQKAQEYARSYAKGGYTTTGGGTRIAASSGTASYPLAAHGPIIATPADHQQRALGNWQSDNAVDIGVPAGTRVLAVDGGTVVRVGGSAPRHGGGVIGGYSITLKTKSNAFFYTHLLRNTVRAGQRVRAGQMIGRSGFANNVDHLHIGVQHGDPLALFGGAGTGQALEAAAACPGGGGLSGLTLTGADGKVVVAPGANYPGRPITPETLAFLAKAAGIYGKPIIVTTGTHHSYLTATGNVSDHASGHAADFGMVVNHGTNDGPVGDHLMTACLIAAGDPPARAAAEARTGGIFTRDHGGLRIQCIWRAPDHHDHVHMGARPT